MAKTIKIFKSFEEQEEYALENMRTTTAIQRFQNLFRMQALNNLFHPAKNTERKIIIHKNGFTQR